MTAHDQMSIYKVCIMPSCSLFKMVLLVDIQRKCPAHRVLAIVISAHA